MNKSLKPIRLGMLVLSGVMLAGPVRQPITAVVSTAHMPDPTYTPACVPQGDKVFNGKTAASLLLLDGVETTHTEGMVDGMVIRSAPGLSTQKCHMNSSAYAIVPGPNGGYVVKKSIPTIRP